METLTNETMSNNDLALNERSFFHKERKQFKALSIAMIAITSLFSLYFVLALALPFCGERGLMDAVPYFGWPIYALLFLFVWIPGTFVAFNMYRKKRYNDFQLILEKKSIMRTALLLMIPTLFTSLIFLRFRSVFVETKEFKAYAKKASNESQIWLSDSRPMKATESASLGLAWLVVVFWAIIIVFPIYKLIKQTFNGELELTLAPSSHYSFSFKHFTRLFDNYLYLDWMWNTLFIAIITMIVVVVLSTFSAYIYSRFRFKTKKASLLLVMTLGIIPAAAAIAAYYVLSVILSQGLNLNAKWLLIFLYAGGGTVGNIFVLKGYLDNISTELDDAAKIDGCSKMGTFFRVIFPLMKPMIAITAVGAFVGPFGDFILPGILFSDPKDFTLAQGLQSLASGNGADQTAFAAGSIIIAVPITIIIIISQTLLTKGSTAGGVKG